MQYQTFSKTISPTYPVVVLAPKLETHGIVQEYLDPGMISVEDVIAYKLHTTGKKTSASDMRDFLSELLPTLVDLGAEYILVTDSEYFKVLTGVNKSDPYLGYVLPNAFPATMQGLFQVVLVPNYRQVFYDPARTRAKIQQSLTALYEHRSGSYREPGCSIISFSAYPQTTTDIALWLQKLLAMDCDLTCDIEGFSLKHHSAGIGSISFAWNQHEGIAFAVDLGEDPVPVRHLLIRFFTQYAHTGRTMRYHNISYDASVLIYQLFMKDLIDTEGLLNGLEIMLGNFDCTKLITYLATNSCAGNELGLKVQAQEYAGNYAVDDIKDITKIPLPQLLEYNLIDALSTWYVFERHWNTMVADEQLDIYQNIFKPAVLDVVQMQLTGMPVDMAQVLEADAVFEADRADCIRMIQAHPLVQEFTYTLDEEHVEKRNEELVKKRIKLGDEPQEFNPNSAPQKQRLIYEVLGLPVIERTKAKQASTTGETLEKLKAFTEDPSIKDLLNAFLEYAAVDKLYSTFMPPMKAAVLGPDGVHYLFGNFNLGGTVSGRLSSSDPNLQTIPTKKNKRGRRDYAKIIKKCFIAPPGWVLVGLDFASLEDKISALTTNDPNKIKVYTDGYDGHSLRAFSYFGEQMPDIVDTLESINSIQATYPDERQESKVPTFLLTYQGTYMGMMAKCNFSEEKAKLIEARYHELYKVSDAWVADKLEVASQTGYITAAFGLRVRTPLLAQVILGTSKTPHEAAAEGRTAGNALGQSWCLLNTRAASEFMGKVRKSDYRLLIRPTAHIHDAQYLLIKDDLSVLRYVNHHLVQAVEWQDHPDIWHDKVKLGGELAVFYPNWASSIGIPNGASSDDVLDIIATSINK